MDKNDKNWLDNLEREMNAADRTTAKVLLHLTVTWEESNDQYIIIVTDSSGMEQKYKINEAIFAYFAQDIAECINALALNQALKESQDDDEKEK